MSGVKIRFTASELKKVDQRLKRYQGNTEKKLAKTIEETASRILDSAKIKVPVDKGDLKRSGKIEDAEEFSKRVRFADFKASWHEFGTVHHPSATVFKAKC